MLHSIKLVNFKSHTASDFDFKGQSAAIIGPNASGKTNLLEAIYYSFLTKQFGSSQSDLINSKSDFFKITTNFTTDNSHELEYRVKASKVGSSRDVKLNQVKKKTSEIIGLQPVVVFVPDDTRIITDGPSFRRNLLNSIAVQSSPRYLEALNTFQKLLRQRNSLLYAIKNNLSSNHDQLFVYNLQMSEPIEQIYKMRNEVIDYINGLISSKYSGISGGKDRVMLEYSATLPLGKDEIIKKLEETTMIDKKIGFTSVGPHKDDYTISLNGKNSRHGFSRGENRTLTLALKLAELEYIKSRSSQSPILLLDDVMSELDDNRQLQLLELAKKQQTIMTSTKLASGINDFNIIKL